MASQELLLFDAAPSLLGESSTSLFDCMDSEVGVDDFLCGTCDLEQVSSPAPLQSMRPLMEGKTLIEPGSWEAVPSLSFHRLTDPPELSGPILCIAHELELQAKQLEEQHATQAFEGNHLNSVCTTSFQPVAARQSASQPQSTEGTSFSSASTVMKAVTKGENKPKPRSFVSSPATLALSVRNSQAVQAGAGCLQPGAWRGCKKSAWCNRENRHRGLCNSRASIPGIDAYSQPAPPTDLIEQPAIDTAQEQSVQTPAATLTPTSETQCQLDNDSEPGSCSDLETYSVYTGTDLPPMVQQQELQPLVPCSSTSSEMGGRLSSLDLGFKFDEQCGSESTDQPPDTNAFLSTAIQYHSGTDYSDEEDDVNDSDDDADSICSGSTLSGDGQESMVSDMMEAGFDDMSSDGGQPSYGSGGPIRKQRSHGGVQRCVNAGFPGQACTQCQAQSTPVWRAGPMGPKTLCNACGVRWMKHSKRK